MNCNVKTFECLGVIGALTLGVMAAPAHAQSQWNRAVKGVSVIPSPGGSAGEFDVHVIWSAGVSDDLSTTLDLSTQVDLFVGTALVSSDQTQLQILPRDVGCVDTGMDCSRSDCGRGFVNGVINTMFCFEDFGCVGIECGCSCQFPPLATRFSQVSLRPEDEIMVLLRPAPGALPDGTTHDDVWHMPPGGAPVFWDRQITDVELIQTRAGEVDVNVSTRSVIRGIPADTDLGYTIVIEVDGQAVRNFPVPNIWAPATICPGGCLGQVCGVFDGVDAFCDESATYPGTCVCAGASQSFPCPAIAVLPGQRVTVILRPTPGALPELPGFPEDEEEVEIPCPGDFTGDGRVTTADLTVLLGAFGQPVPPGTQGDLTGDGLVTTSDLTALLALFGTNCFPV